MRTIWLLPELSGSWQAYETAKWRRLALHQLLSRWPLTELQGGNGDFVLAAFASVPLNELTSEVNYLYSLEL